MRGRNHTRRRELSLRGFLEESSGENDTTERNECANDNVNRPVLPGSGDGEHSEGEEREHPEEPLGAFGGEAADDGDGRDDVAAGDDTNGVVNGDETAVDLILPAVGRGRAGHFGGDEIPNASNDEKGKEDGNEVLVEDALVLEQVGEKPRADEHEEIGNGHQRPEGDPVGHFHEAMGRVGTMIDDEINRQQERADCREERGTPENLHHDCSGGGYLIEMQLMKTIRMMSMVILACQQLWASPVPDFPFLITSAEARKAVVPDQAEITFKVMSYKAKSGDAVNEVENVLRKLIPSLIKAGVKKENLEVADLEKSEVRERTNDFQNLEILGYDVRRSVTLNIENLELYTPIITLIYKTDGVVRIDSDFESSKKEDLESEMLSDACAKARKKGERLAAAAGVKIKRVQAVSDQGVMNFSKLYGLSGNYEYSSLLPPVAAGSSDEKPPSIFVPKEILYGASVEILFRLEE